MRDKTILAAALLGACLFAGKAHAAPVVIVGAEVPADAVNDKVLKRLYKGGATSLKGTRVELVLPPQKSDNLAQFLDQGLRMKESSFERMWMQRVLSGNGVAPRRLTSAEAMAYVMNHPYAIAVVEDAQLIPGTHVVWPEEQRGLVPAAVEAAPALSPAPVAPVVQQPVVAPAPPQAAPPDVQPEDPQE